MSFFQTLTVQFRLLPQVFIPRSALHRADLFYGDFPDEAQWNSSFWSACSNLPRRHVGSMLKTLRPWRMKRSIPASTIMEIPTIVRCREGVRHRYRPFRVQSSLLTGMLVLIFSFSELRLH